MLVNGETGAPVELYMEGYDFVFSSHPDIYIFTYQYFSEWSNASVYDKPTTCSTAGRHSLSRSTMWRAREMLGRLQQLHPESRPINDEFDLFATRYAKHYPTVAEREERRSTFESNHRLIQQHNARKDVTYTMAMNHFGDMTAAEMRSLVYPRNDRARKYAKAHPAHATHKKSDAGSNPSYVNWVEKGAVNPPKDQGICGSCWTFGTIGSIEGAWAVKTGKLLSLSEQQLVDCAWTPWNDPDSANLGCDGGYAAAAMQWAVDNGGLATEMSYPYLMQDHWCQAGDVSSGVQLRGYVNVTQADESALMDAVANIGPVAIAIDAMYPSLTFYQSGVYSDPNCKSDLDSLDHEVLAVGYGTTSGGQDYWLIKNSWSTHWGDSGYVYMLRGQNMCGVASQATYPTF
jgi:C1A family cysteine protease